MNIQVAGLTIRGLEGSSVYQYIYSLGYQDGFRDYFDQTWQDKFGAAEQTSSQPLYQQAWQATGRTFEKWRDFFGIETTADFQTNLREDCRDGFRACFELTFKEFHEADDEETYEHLFELAWRKALIAQITRLIEKRSMPLRFDGAAVRIRHLSELENLWLDFNRLHWMTLAEDHSAFFIKRA